MWSFCGCGLFGGAVLCKCDHYLIPIPWYQFLVWGTRYGIMSFFLPHLYWAGPSRGELKKQKQKTINRAISKHQERVNKDRRRSNTGSGGCKFFHSLPAFDTTRWFTCNHGVYGGIQNVTSSKYMAVGYSISLGMYS